MTATSGGWFVRAYTLVLFVIGCQSAPASDSLPRFTEEREAAALHFVRKHCPELIPLLEDLKKGHRATYERQIRETFQITEYLADLHDDEKRYDLELKVWKAENKAMVLVARLATAREEDRKAIEGQLRALAKELVGLDIKAMEHRVEVLDHELTAAREELAKSRDGVDRSVREKFEGFLEKARKKRSGP
jgi:hypothetical protein